MTEYILRMSNGWKDNDVLDVHKEFMQLTLAIVCKALLGFEIESEASEIGKHVTALVEYFNRARLPLAEVIEKLPLSSNRLFRYAKKHLDTIICRIIDNHGAEGLIRSQRDAQLSQGIGNIAGIILN